MNDVAAQDSWLDAGDTKALPLPDIAHARYNVVASDRAQFLLYDFGSTIGLIDMFCDNGCFGDNDAWAGVLKFGIDADVFSLAVAFTVNPGLNGDTAVRNEHAGHLFLLRPTNWRLQSKATKIDMNSTVLSDSLIFNFAPKFTPTAAAFQFEC